MSQPLEGVVMVSDAATVLGVTGARVRQLLDDPMNPLGGPPSRGRGHARYVWAHSLAEVATARAIRSPMSPHASTYSELAPQRSTIEDADQPEVLRVRITDLELRNRRLDQQLSDTRMAALKGRVAADDLREAAEHEARSFELLMQAMAEQRLATQSLRRAERSREEAVAPFLIDIDQLGDITQR